jgi:type 2 lantibiotic biosynthesis protein LanM
MREVEGIKEPSQIDARRGLVVDPFLKGLLQNFELRVRRAVVLEVNRQRVLGLLSGGTPHERFLDFVKKFDQSESRLGFLRKYPVLARYAQRRLELWVRACSEFLAHLSRDREKLESSFGIETHDPLESFDPSGDTHNEGRSVATLTFRSGRKLLYKPRNLDLDARFQELLTWCNAEGLEPRLKIMTVVSFDDHGWVEFLPKENASSEGEFFGFYRRLGSLLAILYALETVDIFFENLVAAGSYPVAVDLETLFHPQLAPKATGSASDAVREVIRTSVMAIGILPRPSLSDGGRQIFDISAVGASVHQKAPYSVLGIENFLRDDIRITHIPGWIPRVHNRPDDNTNRGIPPDAILDGFSATYEFLRARQDTLLSPEGPLWPFRECRRRLIVRDTTRYGGLEVDAFHPDLLRDDLDRAWHWDNLWSDARKRPGVEPFIASELNQVHANDIPHFAVQVDGTEIVGADGTSVIGVDIPTGWEAATSRIRDLSTADLQRQEWFIRASLGASARVRALPLSTRSKSDLLRGACEIGDVVTKSLTRHGDCAAFLSVASIRGEDQAAGDAFAIDVAGPGLYDGASGVALFLAYLGRESGRREYSDAARALLTNIVVERDSGSLPKGIGGFLGLGSVAYTFTHVAALWNDAALLRIAESFVEELGPQVEYDRSLDLLSGSAGCILSLLPLIEVNPASKAMAVAIRCAERLVAKQAGGESRWMTMEVKRGFSHGFAGVATALHRLGRSVGEDRYIRESLEALDRERSLLRDGQWTDSHQIDGRCQVSWCHGAPGIALGRLGMRRGTYSLDLGRDISAALEEICNHFWIPSHCLCHGTLGNLEPLLVARGDPDFETYSSQLQGLFEQVLEALVSDGWNSLLPNQTLGLGLMTGLSGVGYSLLRFHNSIGIPSVLTLDGPATKVR